MTKEEAARHYGIDNFSWGTESKMEMHVNAFIAGYDYADPIGALRAVNDILIERHHLNIELLLGKTLEQLYQIFRTEQEKTTTT